MIVLALLALLAQTQQPIGTVSTSGAEVEGTVRVQQDRAEIATSGTITSASQTSTLTLTRGGQISICLGSSIRVAQSSASDAPLLLALNRGALEAHTSVTARDVLMTPDLRFDFSESAPLDLRMRLAPNGDTCIDNRGPLSPVLHVTEQFGTGGYFIRPGQHLLFEHGNLHEVVDRETSNCGCPVTSTDPSAFPEAISQGLAAPQIPQAPPGQTHTQVAAVVTYNAAENPAAPTPQPTPALPVKPPSSNPFRAIGHFFKKLFG